MQRVLEQTVAVILLSVSLTGCMSAYVENKAPAISDVKASSQPTSVKVEVEAYTNGDKNDNLQQKIQPKAVETLVNTKVFTVDPAAAATLKLKVSEDANKGAAFAKGFLTGFTFFLIGTTSEADYTMDVSLIENGSTVFNKQYTEKAYITAGATAGTPDNSKKVELTQGVEVLTQDLLLQFLKEYNH